MLRRCNTATEQIKAHIQGAPSTAYKNVLVPLEKQMATESALKQLDHHVWGTTLGCYQKYTPKLSKSNHPFFRAEDCLAIDIK